MNYANTLTESDHLYDGEVTYGPHEDPAKSDLVRYDLLQASIADTGQVVDAGPVREHLQMLLDSGMQTREIAALSGVSRSALGRVLYASPANNLPPQANVSEATYLRVLCVTTDMISDDALMVDSTGTIRRMRALATLGYSMKVIAEESGVGYFSISEIEKRKRVRATVAESIREAYSRLSMMEPRNVTQAEKAAISKTKLSAAQHKWLGPKAWTDSDIDDPNDEGRMRCECKTVKHQHGTRDAYLTDKCRCTLCKETYRAIVNHNRRMEAYGRSTVDHMVDAAPARKHVKALVRRGWGVDKIVEKTGVGKTTICRLVYGEPARKIKPTISIKSSTNEKLLAFSPAGKRARFEGTVYESVDALGTQRRIQALVACGHSMTRISEEAGTYKQAITNIMKGDRVLVSTAASFKAVYDKLRNVTPPRNTASEKKAYTTAKKMAAENGWLPPVAWSDYRIDDPAYKAVS